MKQQMNSGSTGDGQKQKVTTPAPGKVGARGLQPVQQKKSVQNGPRQLKSGSSGG